MTATILNPSITCPVSTPASVQRLDTPSPVATLMRDRARQIQSALADVNPMTVEEWEASFRPEADREMCFWLTVAQRYQQAVAARSGMSLQERKQCLHRLLAAR